MKNPLLILASCLLILSVASCQQDDDNNPDDPVSQLPPATQTGENTFGFLLNGEAVNVTNTNNQFAIYQGEFLQFGALGITIILEDPFEINENYSLILNEDEIGRSRYTSEMSDLSLCVYDYEDTYRGNIRITNLDNQNYIVSGVFEFSTVNNECENIDITEGRFDLKYIP